MGGSGLSVRIGSLAGLATLACGLVLLSTSGRAAPPTDDAASARSYIVVLEDSIRNPAAVAHAQVAAHGGRVGLIYRYAFKGYSATLSKAAVAVLRKDPKVRYVTLNAPGEGEAQTTPTGVKRVFALANPSLAINAVDDISVPSDIAIIDTGIDSSHPDLKVVGSYTCVPAVEEEEEGEIIEEEDIEIEELEEGEEECREIEGGSTDPRGHGTHVAGTAAARDNGSFVVGVAPGARLWSVKVINSQDQTNAARIAGGLNWVIAHDDEIEVANMSLICFPKVGETCKPVEEAIDTAVEHGIVVVVAAGNQGQEATNFSPAKNSNAITVGAIADFDGLPGGTGTTPPCTLTSYQNRWGIEKDDTWGNESNWGAAVDMVAPGVCILSTLPGKKTGYLIGTSMAAPAVSGAAAILAAVHNPANKADVEAIRTQLEEEGNLGWTAEKEGPMQPLLDVTNLLLPLVFCEADLGTGPAEGCPDEKSITHVHESTLAEKKAKLLSKLINVECDVLLLGDVVEGASTPESMLVEAAYTYSNCNSSCTATEENGPAEIEVSKEGHETASVASEGLVHLECAGFINCRYTGEGLTATAKGPLLAKEKNGETVISEQVANKESGSLCPSTAKLDIVTTPLVPTYITN
jgi:subtilisin family serine protease